MLGKVHTHTISVSNFLNRYYGDYFHFMQANLRRLHHNLQRKLLPTERTVAVSALRTLWWSTNVEAFEQNRVAFIEFWQQHCPSYAEYFNNEWLHHIRPSVWARYVVCCGCSYIHIS